MIYNFVILSIGTRGIEDLGIKNWHFANWALKWQDFDLWIGERSNRGENFIRESFILLFVETKMYRWNEKILRFIAKYCKITRFQWNLDSRKARIFADIFIFDENENLNNMKPRRIFFLPFSSKRQSLEECDVSWSPRDHVIPTLMISLNNDQRGLLEMREGRGSTRVHLYVSHRVVTKLHLEQ